MPQDPDAPNDIEIPKAVQLMWGLDQPGTRGPRKGLTLDQVLDAAIEIADADGLAAVSMSRLAKSLGFTTMSVYRYVDSKEMLVELLMDRVVGLPPRLDPALPWRKALEEWASAELKAIFAHPWFLDIPLVSPPAGPNNMAWLEAGLQAMAKTPLPEPVKFQLVANISLYVMGRARMMREMAANAAAEDDAYPVVLATLLDPARYPALTKALSAQMFESEEVDWADADFRFGLDRLLDGYERYVAAFE